jgi:hypothetical protein
MNDEQTAKTDAARDRIRDRVIAATPKKASTGRPPPGTRGLLYLDHEQCDYVCSVFSATECWSQVLRAGEHVHTIYVGTVLRGPDFAVQVLNRAGLEPEWEIYAITSEADDATA